MNVIIRKLHIVKYWQKLVKTENCMLQNIYEEMNIHLLIFQNIWCYNVKELLGFLGFYEAWLSQSVSNIIRLLLLISKIDAYTFFYSRKKHIF